MDAKRLIFVIEHANSALKQDVFRAYLSEIFNEIHKRMRATTTILNYVNNEKFGEGIYIFHPSAVMALTFDEKESFEDKCTKVEQCKEQLFQDALIWDQKIEQNRFLYDELMEHIENNLKYKSLLYLPDKTSIVFSKKELITNNKISDTRSITIEAPSRFRLCKTVQTSYKSPPADDLEDRIVVALVKAYQNFLITELKTIMKKTKVGFSDQTKVEVSDNIDQVIVYPIHPDEPYLVHGKMATDPTIYHAVFNEAKKIDEVLREKEVKKELQHLGLQSVFEIVPNLKVPYHLDEGKISTSFDFSNHSLKNRFIKESTKRREQIRYYAQINNINHHNPKDLQMGKTIYFRFVTQVENNESVYRMYEYKESKSKKSVLLLYQDGVLLTGRQRKNRLKELGYGRKNAAYCGI